MRKAYHNVDFLSFKDVFVGISLGYDYCAEHEWGIQGIKDSFGISEPTKKCMGVKARTATKVPTTLLFMEKKLKATKTLPAEHFAVLVMDRSAIQNSWDIEDRENHFFKNIRDKFYLKKDLVVEWDGKGFAIWVKTTENVEKLKTIHEAILKKDIAIGLSVKEAFANSSVNILIPSALDPTVNEKVIETDKDYFNLMDECEKAGLEDLQKRLKEAGKDWFAMSPAWNTFKFKDGSVRETKYPFIIWLNPRNQSRYEFGWFTMEDFEDWIQNKGPIIKTEKT